MHMTETKESHSFPCVGANCTLDMKFCGSLLCELGVFWTSALKLSSCSDNMIVAKHLSPWIPLQLQRLVCPPVSSHNTIRAQQSPHMFSAVLLACVPMSTGRSFAARFLSSLLATACCSHEAGQLIWRTLPAPRTACDILSLRCCPSQAAPASAGRAPPASFFLKPREDQEGVLNSP